MTFSLYTVTAKSDQCSYHFPPPPPHHCVPKQCDIVQPFFLIWLRGWQSRCELPSISVHFISNLIWKHNTIMFVCPSLVKLQITFLCTFFGLNLISIFAFYRSIFNEDSSFLEPPPPFFFPSFLSSFIPAFLPAPAPAPSTHPHSWFFFSQTQMIHHYYLTITFHFKLDIMSKKVEKENMKANKAYFSFHLIKHSHNPGKAVTHSWLTSRLHFSCCLLLPAASVTVDTLVATSLSRLFSLSCMVRPTAHFSYNFAFN